MIRNLFVLVAEFGPISITGFADTEGSAGQSNTDLSVPDGPLGHLFTLRRPHHFFPSASFNKSACMLFSAYIFFRRLFSSSSTFMREIRDASITRQVIGTIAERACRQIWTAICKSWHCSCHAPGTVQSQAPRPPLVSIYPLSSIILIACRAAHNLSVAIFGLFHQNLLIRYGKRNSTFKRY